jgi:uncharacterized protein involved in response to NO
MFTPAFLAFLFTTFPRFASVPVIEKNLYMRIFGLFYLGSVLFVLGSIVSPFLSSIAMIMLFTAHLMALLILKNIYLTSTMEDRHDIFWILIAMGFGLLSHLIFMVSELFSLPIRALSIQIAVYLYLFLVTFSVAQRMVPFFSHSMVDKNMHLLKVVAVLLATHVILETIYPHLSFIADFILAYVVGKELFRWNLPFPNPIPNHQ